MVCYQMQTENKRRYRSKVSKSTECQGKNLEAIRQNRRAVYHAWSDQSLLQREQDRLVINITKCGTVNNKCRLTKPTKRQGDDYIISTNKYMCDNTLLTGSKYKCRIYGIVSSFCQTGKEG